MPPLIRRSVIIIIGIILGSVLGLIASQSISGFSAAAVVSIGKIGLNEPIEEPLAVLERIKTAPFASAVAGRAGRQDLAFMVPVETLSVRNLRDINLIEIRVVAASRDLAQIALAAVTGELQAEHEKKLAPLAQNLNDDLTTLDGLQAEIAKSAGSLSKQSGIDERVDSAASQGLVSARASSGVALAKILEDKIRLRDASAHLRQTAIVAEHPIVELNYSYRLITTGGFAGFLIGLVLNLIFADAFVFKKSVGPSKKPDL